MPRAKRKQQSARLLFALRSAPLAALALLAVLCALPFIARTATAEDNTPFNGVSTRYFSREDAYRRILTRAGTANPFAPLAGIYTWIGGSSTFNTATNWSPNRTSPAVDDQLAFNQGGTITVTNLSTQTIAELAVSANTNVTFQGAVATPTNALTINGPLSVAAGSQLNVSGSNPVSITVSSASQGSISGSMNFAGGAHQLLGGAASAITFNSGSLFTQGAGCTGSVFGDTGAVNTTIFASGSTLDQKAGNSVFGTAGKVVFQTGSLFKISATGVSASYSGRTYANFELSAAATQSATGASALIVDNLTVSAGTFNFNMTATPGHAIKGNISVASGATLTFSPASAATINLNGTSAQTISGSGTLTIVSNATISVSNTTGVTLQRNVATSGTINVLSGGVLNCGTNVVSGLGSGFNLQSGGTLGIGSADGISAGPGGTGNIQTLNKTFNSAANYTYHGSTNQVTGNGIGFNSTANTANNLTVANTGSSGNNTVTLSQAISVNGTFTLTSGLFATTSTNLLTVLNTATGAVSGGSSTSYVNGPMARTLPASLATGSNYAFPIGKGTFNQFELLSPTTTSGGTVTVQAEEFDGNSGGTAGTQMASLNTNRYWSASITNGGGNFTNTYVRLTDSAAVATDSHIGKSATQGGSYNSIGGLVVFGSTITSGQFSSFSFFAIGAGINPPSIQKLFATSPITVGGSSMMTLSVTNPNFVATLTGIAFTDTLPTGLSFNGDFSAPICGGTISVVGATISLTGGVEGPTSGDCNISLPVNANGAATGLLTNTTSAVTSTNGGTGNSASADITVNAAVLKYRSKTNGNWNDFNTWQVDSGSGFVDAIAGQTPASADDTIAIRNTHTVTVTANVNADQLTVESGGILAVDSAITLTVDNGTGTDLTIDGTTNIGSTGVIAGVGSVAVNGTLGVASTNATDALATNVTAPFTLNTGSTVNFNGAGGQGIGARNYYNLTFSNNAKTLASSGTIGIAGTFTPGTNTSHTTNNSTIEFNGTSSQSVPLFSTYYNLTLNNAAGTTGTAGLKVNNTLTVQSGTFTSASDYHHVVINSSGTLSLSNPITVSGDWTNNGTFTNNGNSVTFDGTGAQTITSGGSGAGKTFAGFVVNKSSDTATLAGDLRAITVAITTGTFNQGASFSVNTTAGGTVATVGTNGTWQNFGTGDLTLSGNITNNGTINFNGNGTACGDTDDISISSTGVARTWSGTGTFSMTDVTVVNQTAGTPPVAILVNSGTNAGGNTGWTFVDQCTAGTYTWIGGTLGANTDWQVGTNWSPTRATPAAGDVLIFDGSSTPAPTVTNVPTQTISSLQLKNGVNAVTLNASAIGAPHTLTITGNAGLDIPATNLLTLAGANALTIAVTTGSASTVGGQIMLQGGAHALTGANAGQVVFANNSIFTTTTGFTGNPFGTGTDGSVIFQSGAYAFFNAGSDAFGGSGNTIVTFNLGSNQEFSTSTAWAAEGRTYGNLTLTGASQTYFDSTASTQVTVTGNLTIASGGNTLKLSNTAGGDLNLWGNFTDNGTFTHNNRTIKFQGGTATQTVFKNGAAEQFFDVLIGKVGGSVQMLGDVTINGALQFGGLAGSAIDVLDINSNFLTLNGTVGSVPDANSGLKGNLNGSVLIITGTGALGTVSFVSGGQEITGFQLNRNTTVPFGTSLTIGQPSGAPFGSLDLVNGIVDMGANTLTLNPNVSNSRTSGYVSGNLKRVFAATSTFTFHVGTANGYSPVGVNVTAGTGDLTVKAVQGPQPNITGTNALQRYWILNGTGITADLTFNYLDPTDIPVTATESSFVIFKYDGSFTTPGGTVNTGANTATINGVTSFSDWTLAEAASVQEGSLAYFDGATSNVTEGNAGPTIKNVCVTRSGGTDGAVSVAYATSDGTAQDDNPVSEDNDYVATSGTLNWADNESGDKCFNVTINGDTTFEPTETINITLSSPTGGATISQTGHIINVQNDDAGPGAALDFDGVDDYVTVPSDPAVHPTTAITIETWVKPASVQTYPFARIADNESAQLLVTGSTNFRFQVFTTTGAGSVNAPFTPGSWYHVAATYDGAMMRIYVNGSLIDSAARTGTITASTQPLLLGFGYDPQYGNFQMDEFRLWDRALCEAEIDAQMSCELTGSESGLAAYYKFNQGTAGANNAGVTTATDTAGGDNNGTLTNFALTGATSNWVAPGGVTTGSSCAAYLAPEIDVRGGSGPTSIADGDPTPSATDGTDFDNVTVGSSVSHPFTIANTGAAALTLTGTPFVQITGPGASQFNVSPQPSSPIAATSGTTNFSIIFQPTGVGLATATVHIANDDCDEGDYDFVIQGSGVAETSVTVSGGNLIVTDGNGGTSNDTLTISRLATPDRIRVNDPNNALACGAGTTQVNANTCDAPLGDVTGNIQVNTLAGNDTLTLDLGSGDFIPAGGLSYAGGNPTSGPGDKLIITGGAQGTVTYNYTNASDGNIVMSNFGTVSYTGLEPITNSGDSTDTIFNLPAAGNVATLSDLGGGSSRLSSTGTFEQTDFANPSNSLTITGGALNDAISVGALASSYPSLTINGNEGDDTVNLNGNISFASNANLDVDLQNDDPTPGIDSASIGTNAQLTMAGTGAATVKVSRNITLASGSKLEVANGNLTLEANQQAIPTTGNFRGILVTNAVLKTTGTGSISLKGKAGADGTPNHMGIQVTSGSSVSSTQATAGAGTITLNGVGAAGTQNNRGVEIALNPTVVTSVVGDISLTGTAGTGGPNNYGVSLLNGATVSSTGAAKITIGGTGGSGTTSSVGARVSGEDTQLTSAGGDIFITGQGGSGTTGNHHGVSIAFGALVSATGGAKIIVNGTGGSGGSSNAGVIVSRFGPTNLIATNVTSNSGDIQFTGQGGTGTGLGQIGWNIDSKATVVATGSANISIAGTGGSGASDNYGVGFEGAGEVGTGVSAVNGSIIITGVSTEATGTSEDGVRFEDSVAAQAVLLSTSGAGTVTITGTAGNSSSAGIHIVDDCLMTLTGATNTFVADSMDLGTSNVSVTAGANALTLRQKTNAIAINLGGADSATELGLTDTELDLLSAGTLNIGNNSSGPITVSADITRSAATNMALTGDGDVVISGGQVNTGGGTLLLDPGAAPDAVKPTKSLTDVTASTLSFGSDLAIVIDGTTVDTQYTQLNVAGMVNITGVSLVISGLYTPAAGDSFIIVNNDGSSDAITGTFNGLLEGALVNVNGTTKKITYVGGDGNDVELDAIACPTALTVNSNGDDPDASPGDGACATTGAVCTLRAAIQEANALTACGTIDINFSGVTSPINLGGALPSIDHNVNINGPGAASLTVQRSTGGDYRIFNINSGRTVTITGLTIANGRLLSNVGPNHGGGIYNGGTLTLTSNTVSGNSVNGSGNLFPQNFGGGIYNTGTLTIASTTFSGNSASGSNGPTNYGGAIYNNATLHVTNSAFSGNSVSGSNTSNIGAGIYNVSTLTVTNSTFSGNSATGDFTVNYGGAIANQGGTVRLFNSTLSGNITSGNTSNNNGGGILNFSGTVSAKTTVIAGNTGTDGGPDISGAFTSQGYNFIGKKGSSTGFTNGVNNDQVGSIGSPLDPLLDALANNGGPTQTMRPLNGSPLIETGTDVTTLNGSITNMTTTVILTDATSIPAGIGFLIQIDAEQMSVIAKASNTLTVVRGANGTTAAAHSNGAAVNPAFDQRDTGFPRNIDGNADSIATVDIGAYEAACEPPTPTASNGGPYCEGATIQLSTPTVSGATYAWTGPNSFTSSDQNPTRANATTADAGTYSVTITVNGCTSAAGTTNVVVNATPATPTAANDGPICQGGTANLSTPTVSGATYAWTGPNGFTSSAQNPTAVDAGTYFVTITVNGCTSAAGSTTVVVNPIPATPTASNGGPYCEGATIQLSTPTVSGATYSWTGPNGFTSSDQNPARANATTADAGTYFVTITVNGCSSAAGSTTVVVNPTPATPTPSNGGPYCEGATIQLSTPTVSGATYSWTGPNSFTSSDQNPTRANATTLDGGDYFVTITVNGCTSAAGTTNVVVNATPATPTASNGGPYCEGATIQLSTPTVSGATYSWTGPNSFTSSDQNPTRANATTADAGDYFVTITVNGCTSAAGTTNVVVNATPATPTASNGGPYCEGATIQLSTPTVSGATYSWTGPNSFTSSDQNPTRANATTADAGTYSVTVTVNGCTSAAGTTNVVLNATPATPTASNGGPYCEGATIQLNTPTVSGATYSWTGPNSFTSSDQNPTRANATTADAGTYSVTVTVNGCTSAAGTTNVVVNSCALSIDDVALPEGNSGPADFVFTVTKTGPSAAAVDFQIQAGTTNPGAGGASCGTAGVDYETQSGSLNFTSSETQKQITIKVCGETTPELNETLFVKLLNPSGVTLGDDTGLGTILNDDESVATGQLIISEFRLSGPGANATEQANNEFIEIYNSTDQDLFVTTTDGSTGWAVANSSGAPIFFVPNGTTIPARGHYLGTNTTGYSLKDYGGTDAALGDATWTTDVPHNTAIAVFRTNNAANFNTTNRLDSVGPNTETNTLYKEGTGFAPLLTPNLEHTFFRQICVFQAGCPTPGRPRDTQDNAADFIFADTMGTSTSSGQRLGAPGPENLASPIKRDPAINLLFLDATVGDASAPNRIRNSTPDPGNASQFGTMTIRRRIVNQTGSTVTRLRLRVIDMTTHPSGPLADLRLRSSSDQVIGSINDPNTCTATGTPSSPACTVNVTGLTLDQPPNQPAAIGGGLNSTVTVPLPSGLAPGQSINVNFLLGVQKTGQFRFYLVIEALP